MEKRESIEAKEKFIVDSNMTWEEAVLKNLDEACPREILERQVLVPVSYYAMDNLLHKGQVVVDERLAKDVEKIFDLIWKTKFPVDMVVPISDPRFLKDNKWDDNLSMEANNTSGFNYRKIAGKDVLSEHAYGFAIDINPKLNPYIIGEQTNPQGAVYDLSLPGTLTEKHPVVEEFLRLGWQWGGLWVSVKDYQHFDKKP